MRYGRWRDFDVLNLKRLGAVWALNVCHEAFLHVRVRMYVGAIRAWLLPVDLKSKSTGQRCQAVGCEHDTIGNAKGDDKGHS